MAVGFVASATSGSQASVASFNIGTLGTGARAGIVFVCNHSSSSDIITGVTWNGVAMTRLYSAADTNTEPGFTVAYFLDNVTNGTITVSRTNNTNITVGYAASLSAGAGRFLQVAQVKTVGGGGTVQTNADASEAGTAASGEQSLDDGSPGTNSMRFAAAFTGAATPLAAGTNSTSLQSLDSTALGSSFVRETTAGQGSRNVGFATGTTDDYAAVFVAVREGFTTVSGSFTANAIIKKTPTGSFTADAIIKKTIAPTGFTADASKSILGSGSFTADAIRRRTFTSTATESGSVAAGGLTFGHIASPARLAQSFVPSVTGSISSVTYRANTYSNPGGPTDQFLVELWDDSAGSPGALIGSVDTRDGTSMSSTPTDYTAPPTDLAVVAGTTYWLVFRRTSPVTDGSHGYQLRTSDTTDAYSPGTENQYNSGTTTWSANVNIKDLYFSVTVAALTARAFITAIASTTYTFTDKKADAVILANSGTKTFTASAVIFKTLSGSFAANAIVSKPSGTKTFTADAVILKTVAPGFTASAVIFKTLSGSFAADAIKRKNSGTLTFTANAVIKRTQVTTTVADNTYTASEVGFDGTASFEMAAQSFTAPVSGTLLDFGYHPVRYGSPSDNLVVELRSNSSGNPSGTVLATLATIAGSGLPVANFTLHARYSVTPNWPVVSGTVYWIVFRRDGAADDVNSYALSYDGGSGYAGGTVKRYRFGAWADDGIDLTFDATFSTSFFAANAVIKKTQAFSFSASADVFKTRTGSFTANAMFARLIWDDSFTRTVAAGPTGWGPPYVNTYDPVYGGAGTADAFSVDGSVGRVGVDAGDYAWVEVIGQPMVWAGVVQFDLYADTTDPSYTAYQDSADPDGSHNGTEFYVGSAADGWDVSLSNSIPDLTTHIAPEAATWYRFKVFFGSTVGSPGGFKVWKVSDPEPAAPTAVGTLDALTSLNPYAVLFLETGNNIQWYATKFDNYKVWTTIPEFAVHSLFTANAIAQRTQTGTFAADAVVMPRFTADAVIVSAAATVPGSFSADAIVQKTLAFSFSANAVLLRTITTAITANAIVFRTISGSWIANAVILRSTSASFTSASVLFRSASASFTANAVLRVGRSGTLTADAVLKRTIAASATADAVILRGRSSTFTADGWVLRTQSGSFTADAVLRATTGGTFTANAWVQGSNVFGVSADAVLFKTITSSFTADAIKRIGRSGSFTADAILFRTINGTPTADAVVKRTLSGSFTADAVLRRGASASFSADADVRAGRTGSLVSNAVLRIPRSGALTSDAILLRTLTNATTEDAVLRRTMSGSFTGDAVVRATASGTFAANAVVRATPSGTLTANAIVLRTGSQTFAADAVLRRAQSATRTADAALFRSASGSFSADAVLFKAQAASFTADAVRQTTDQTASWTADARLLRTTAGAPTANAILKATITGSFTASAWVQGAGVFGVSADAVLKRNQAAQFGTDSVLKRQFSATFSADAVIKAAFARSATADSVKLKTQTASVAGDSVLLAGRTSGLTANAVLRSPVTGGLTANAAVQATSQATFTADSVRARVLPQNFSANAIIRRTSAAGFAADAFINSVAGTSFTANAVLFSTRAGSFSANAVRKVIVEGQLDVGAILRVPHVGTSSADAVVKRTNNASLTSNSTLRRTRGQILAADSVVRTVEQNAFSAAAVIAVEHYSFLADAILRAGRSGSFNGSAWIGTTHPLTISAGLSARTISAALATPTVSAALTLSTISGSLSAATISATATLDTVAGAITREEP